MKQKMIYLALMLFVLSAASVKAQVTIGSDQDPHEGAVLDLSQSTKLGLLLPHFSLANVTDWQLSGEATNGEGMLIYNTNDEVPDGNGKDIYVWTGSGWKPIGPVTLKRFELDKSHLFLDLNGKEGTITAQITGSDGKPFGGVTVAWSIEGANTTGSSISPATGISTTVTSGSITGSFTVRATANGVTQDCVVTIGECAGVMDVEGNAYYAARFGDAGCWMTQNLRSKKYADGGTTLDLGSNTDYTSKFYNYPAAKEDTLIAHPEYGLLYTWAAASGRTDITSNEGQGESNAGNSENIQGICPNGWHLPSDREWNQLEEVIANSDEGTYGTAATSKWNSDGDADWAAMIGYRGSHGAVMKSATAVVGVTNSTNGKSKGLAANGFDALLVGYMYGGSADDYGTYTTFWSSSSGNGSRAWNRDLHYYGSTGVGRYSSIKYYLRSVRCKKDN